MSFETDFNETKDRYFASEDFYFQIGDSPLELDLFSSLGTPAIDGEVYCTSETNNGKILVEISSDGINYGSQFSLFKGEAFFLTGLQTRKIRLTHSGQDSGYRVLAR